MAARTCTVTIAGPDRRVDVVVSAETPVGELIPTFVELSVDDPPDEQGPQPVWSVAPPGGAPLSLDRTLREAEVHDGAVLALTELRPAAQAPPRPRESHRPRRRYSGPLEHTRELLPERLDRAQRFGSAVRAFFGYEDEPPVVEGAEPLEPSKRDRLTRPRERSAFERARRAWRMTDYADRLERLVAAPQLTRSVTIAVMSPKGGVGKTTITALLGGLLARTRPDRVVAVDTNPDFGSLGRMVAPDHRTFVDDLLELVDHPDLTPPELDGHLGRGFDGLMVLPAPTDPRRMAQLDEAAYTRVVGKLQALVGVIVLDCGTGLHEPAARAALAAADQVVLLSDAQPATASLVAEAADLLKGAGPALTLAVNRMPRKDARIDLGGLDDLVPDARGLVTVADEPQAAAAVAAGEFAWDAAPRSWRNGIGELGTVLAADWPELGLAR